MEKYNAQIFLVVSQSDSFFETDKYIVWKIKDVQSFMQFSIMHNLQ